MRALAAALALALIAAACGGGHSPRASAAPTIATATPAPGATATPSVRAMKARCFGAAARDPARGPCQDPPLNVSVVPRPGELVHGAPCRNLQRSGLLKPCAFGVGESQAKLRFALIGDSHAAHLRDAFSVVAKAQQWRGYQVFRDSCSFVAVGRPLPEPYFSDCEKFKQQLPAWLAHHPRIDTVFVVGLTRDAGNADPNATDPFSGAVAGEIDAWKALPATVKHVVVIRDTPEIQDGTLACVADAVSRGQSAADACAVPRATALHPDPAVTAAAQLGSPRVQAIDLTRYFCDDTRCYPVIGGVVAYKDITHLTPTFSRTLGPYLLAEVRGLAASW